MKKSEINRWFLSAVLFAVSALTGCSNEGPPRVIETVPENIINPTALLLGSTTMFGPAIGLFVSDYIAYVLIQEDDGTNSLFLYDITDSDFPDYINAFIGLEFGIRVVPNGQFEPAGTSLPELSSRINLPIFADGLHTLDVSDAFDIKDAGSFPIDSSGSIVDYSSSSETFFCFANSESFIMLYTPPGGFLTFETILSTEFVTSVSSDNNYCYYLERTATGTSTPQLHIIDPGSTGPNFEIGSVDVEGIDLIIKGSYAYTLKESSGLTIVDVSAATSPVVIGQIEILTARTFNAMSIDDILKRAYIRTETGVSIIDISDPFSPVDIGSFELVDTPTAIYANNGIVYVTTTDLTGFTPSQLLVVDVSQF